MRTIQFDEIENTVAWLCIQANMRLTEALEQRITECAALETSEAGKGVFSDLTANIAAAREENIPICQDTGMAVVFVKLGQDVHIEGGLLRDAVNRGVAKGYTEGFLRCSVVGDPLERVNTRDNSPAVLHIDIVDGDRLDITVCPKGFGSENMSSLKMFTPSATEEDIIDYVVSCVERAGSNPCPPITVGVGIGGDFELSAYLAKKALCRSCEIRNPNPRYAELEARMLEEINRTGIGPQGFGGNITELYVNIEQYPTHIAGLPVAVNIGCHVTRHAHCVL